jgi:transposase
MGDLLEQWRLKPAVRALMAMKGFQTVAAMILVSELGEVHRFTHPRQVMAYLGLVPTENSSSERRRQGHITKCGNAHARWLLVECAQHYVAPPKVSKELSRRQEGESHEVRARAKPAASSLHASFGAATPAKQGHRGYCAGAVRFYLGTVAHPTLLPGALAIGLKR